MKAPRGAAVIRGCWDKSRKPCKSTAWDGINENIFLTRRFVTHAFWTDYLCIYSYSLLARSVCKGCLPRVFEAVVADQLWKITSGALKPGRMVSKLSGQLFDTFSCLLLQNSGLLCMVPADGGTGVPNILRMLWITLVKMTKGAPELTKPTFSTEPLIAAGFGCLA